MSPQIDEIDKRILRELQRDGRLQNQELARRVGLTPSPCLRRVRLLEEAGVIERYVAIVNHDLVGLKFCLFARVWLTSQDAETIDRFISAMQRLQEVTECFIILGDSDALIRVAVADLDDYRRFQAKHLTRSNGIDKVKTELPSQSVKRGFALPIR